MKKPFPIVPLLALAAVLFTVSAAALLLYGNRQAPAPRVLAELPDFSLLDQNGDAVARRDLLGAVHVVNFVFTSCPDVCPLLSAQMKSVAERLEGTATRFVSVTVDPKRDTPERLKSYGARYGAEAPRWRFLTGKTSVVGDVVVRGFLTALDPRPDDMSDANIFTIAHGERFVVLDRHARLRAFLTAKTNAEVGALADVVARVAQEK